MMKMISKFIKGANAPFFIARKLLFFQQKKEAKKTPTHKAVLFIGKQVYQICSMAYSLSEALNLLEDGNFYPLAYVSVDKNRKEAGRIIRIDFGKIVRQENKQAAPVANIQPSKKQKATQNHSLHATRNIRLRNGGIRKMHIHTLFMFNNQPIL